MGLPTWPAPTSPEGGVARDLHIPSLVLPVSAYFQYLVSVRNLVNLTYIIFCSLMGCPSSRAPYLDF